MRIVSGEEYCHSSPDTFIYSKRVMNGRLNKIPANSLRSHISSSEDEVVIHAVDILASPQYRKLYQDINPLSYTKCSRALPSALEEDIVVLIGDVDTEYHSWLRSFGLGTDRIVSYGRNNSDESLSEIILKDPKPLEDAIAASGRKPLIVPFYCGDLEHDVAVHLKAELFGSPASVTELFFNKEIFKAECIRLGINMVDGISHEMTEPTRKKALDQFERTVRTLLGTYPKLIVRAVEGAGGKSVFKIEDSTFEETKKTLLSTGDTQFLIEPFLSVIASPNDQWVITRSGEVHHLGLSAQLFDHLKHVGNIKGQYFSQRIVEKIASDSYKIALSMKEQGYVGVFGVDYIVTDDEIYPIENNARVNGSSFAIMIVERLEPLIGKAPCWKFFKASVPPCSYNELTERLSPILFDGARKNSVFPFDLDTLSSNGQFAPLLLGEDMYHIEFLESALKDLGVEIN